MIASFFFYLNEQILLKVQIIYLSGKRFWLNDQI